MNTWIRNGIILTLMLAASGFAIALKPKHLNADQAPKISYAKIVPNTFGDWVADEVTNALVVNPQQEAQLNLFYSETVARTYTHRQTGKRIMLSIAYGAESTRTQSGAQARSLLSGPGFQLLGTEKAMTHRSWRHPGHARIDATRSARQNQ